MPDFEFDAVVGRDGLRKKRKGPFFKKTHGFENRVFLLFSNKINQKNSV